MPVVIDGSVVVGAAQLNATYVFEPRDAGVAARLDHYVAEFGWIDEPALRIQRVLECRAPSGERWPADDSRRHLDVLLLDRVDDVACGHVSRRELVGIEPQPHRIVTHTEDRDVADAPQPGDLILHLQGYVVADEQRVVRAVG